MELEELDFELSFELDFQLPLSFDEEDDDDDLFHPSSFEPPDQLFLVDEDAHVSLLELLPQSLLLLLLLDFHVSFVEEDPWRRRRIVFLLLSLFSLITLRGFSLAVVAAR